MRVRRVVTGHNQAGKAVVADDTQVDALTVGVLPGAEFHRLWGADQPPSFPDDGSRPAEPTYFPPVGGFRFALFTVAPDGTRPPANLDVGAARRELDEKLPGLVQYMEPDAPGMHTTATIDFEVVLSGEVWLELDDGVEVHLKPGDCVVQNGTRHAWRNHGTEVARLAVFLIGAHHKRFPNAG